MKYKFATLFVLSCTLLLADLSLLRAQPYEQFHPGEQWLDDIGTHINAHGGGILYQDGTYYWFGEHKGENNRAEVGVRVYSSTDLYNWKNEGVALAVSDAPDSEIVSGAIIERPKVIYNEKTDTYVMWFHLELKGQGYSAARTGVAVSENVTGPYRYLRSYRPNAGDWPVRATTETKRKKYDADTLEWWTDPWREALVDGLFLRRDQKGGQMSRDMTLFVDDDGTAYHIHSAEENATLHISKLSDDFQSFTGRYNRILPGKFNEAPAIFKHVGKYYIIASGTTGWDPNPARLLVADSLFGEWQMTGNPAKGERADITFDSQSTFILNVQGKEDAYIYMGDRWEPENPITGTYVWLPIEFDENGQPFIQWHEEWDLSYFDE
ncbi:glycoside hydrolase family 43 protein [Aliifodinibius sp. S!AR15-10]|uniref:glycoside hydrolase family 43 protein n=1 Tax=Aliifodinibius sp. S!AR15-10 TaxID=2950437 RepID=UPI0028655079|nr:glycoside hydrolase family 43 protein [Aliifodinibius sp. S!AR15-10]MDR8392773.1 glycoside hydrolase family 43 protein [Aliifodinibius sp. S!AR15-10]